MTNKGSRKDLEKAIYSNIFLQDFLKQSYKIAKKDEFYTRMKLLAKQSDYAYEKEKLSGVAGGSAGSSTALGVSVPLKLKVNCAQHSANLTILYLGAIVLSIAVIGLIVVRKRKR